MSYDILSTLREMEPTFSKGQKRIARYITEDYDKAAFMTANRLGKTVGVSESTVVRFAVDLGFDGYPSMQKAMQEMVLNRLTSVQRIEVANDRLGDQDVVSTVLRSDMEKIRQTEEMVSREEFSAAVNAILKAKRVYILGVRSVEPLANFLGYYLNYMFNNVHVVSGFGAGVFLHHDQGREILPFCRGDGHRHYGQQAVPLRQQLRPCADRQKRYGQSGGLPCGAAEYRQRIDRRHCRPEGEGTLQNLRQSGAYLGRIRRV